MCYLRFWTCLLLWAFRVEWASKQSGNNSERLQSPARLFVGLTWKNYEKLRWYGLQIVRDQISYCNHHAIWHTVTQNVNVCKRNVYECILFIAFHMFTGYRCILHPSPGFRLLVESSDEQIQWSRFDCFETVFAKFEMSLDSISSCSTRWG